MLGFPGRNVPIRYIKIRKLDGTYATVREGSYEHRFILEQYNRAYEAEIARYNMEQSRRSHLSESSGSLPTFREENEIELYDPRSFNALGVYRPTMQAARVITGGTIERGGSTLSDAERRALERLRNRSPEGRWYTPGTPRTQRRAGPYVQGYRGRRASEVAAEARTQALYSYLPLRDFDPENILTQQFIQRMIGTIIYPEGTLGAKAQAYLGKWEGLAAELGGLVPSTGALTGTIQRSDFEFDPKEQRFRRIRSARALLKAGRFETFWNELRALTNEGSEVPEEGTQTWVEYQHLLADAAEQFLDALSRAERKDLSEYRAFVTGRFMNVLAELPADYVRMSYAPYNFPLSDSKVAVLPDLVTYQQIRSVINHIRNIGHGFPGRMIASIAEALGRQGFHGKVTTEGIVLPAWKAPQKVGGSAKEVSYGRIKKLVEQMRAVEERTPEPKQVSKTIDIKVDFSKLYKKVRFNLTAMTSLPPETTSEVDRVIVGEVEKYYRDLGDFMRSDEELLI